MQVVRLAAELAHFIINVIITVSQATDKLDNYNCNLRALSDPKTPADENTKVRHPTECVNLLI